MATYIKGQITDWSSRTMRAFFNDANKVMDGRDVTVISPAVINKKCQRLLDIIYKGGKEAEKATEQLIALSCPFLLKGAKHFCNREMGQVDLVQEVALRLYEEIPKRDLREEGLFTVFLFHFAKSRIVDALYEKENLINIPKNTMRRLQIYERFRREYLYENLMEPTVDEFLDYYKEKYGKRLKRDYILKALESYRSAKSLDEPYGDDESQCCFSETLSLGFDEPSLASADRPFLIKAMRSCLNSKRDFNLMYEYFGLDDGFHTDNELAEKYGLKECQFNYLVKKSKDKLGTICKVALQ